MHTVGSTERTRTIRPTRRLAAACLVASVALTLATAGAANSATATAGVGAGQAVGGTVEPQFGAAVAPDGSVAGSSSTIAVNITRTEENGVEVITISPKD